MARENAFLQSTASGTKDKLAEIYGGVMDGVRRSLVFRSALNRNYNGDPRAGSVEINRFKLSALADEGTARTATKGVSPLNSGKKTLNLDQKKEIVEEFNRMDIHQGRFLSLLEDRAQDHQDAIVASLETAFFSTAVSGATEVTVASTVTKAEDIAEKFINALETKSNDWVDGVDRTRLVMFIKSAEYSKLQSFMELITRPTVDGGEEEINVFRGVEVHRSNRQTKNHVCMIRGAVAQMATSQTYSTPERIPLSNNVSVEAYIHYGTEAIMPDLIVKSAD